MLPARNRLQELRHLDNLSLEISLALELEPVDAGRHIHVETAGAPVQLAVRFDEPAFVHQRSHRKRQPRRRKLPLMLCPRDAREAESRKTAESLRLPFSIAPEMTVALFVID